MKKVKKEKHDAQLMQEECQKINSMLTPKKNPLHPTNKSVFLKPDEGHECYIAVNTIFNNKM